MSNLVTEVNNATNVTTTKRTPRTPARKKAKELVKYLRGERPDYLYYEGYYEGAVPALA